MNIGQLVATRGIYERTIKDQKFAIGITEALERYQKHDWGEASEESKHMNDEALATKGDILGVYTIGDEKIWIMTDAGHEVTTILFPDDY